MGVPGEDAYGPDFDRSELSLKSPPRVDSYRGFYFVSLNPRADDLVNYLAGAKDYLAPVPDQSEGGMKVIQGSNQCTVKANWKLMVEKSIDGYHIVPTHRTYLEYITSFGADDGGQTMPGNIPGRGRALGNGHCLVEAAAVNGRAVAHWHPSFGEEAREEIAEVRQQLVGKHAEGRAWQIGDTYRNLLIYPNLIINDVTVTTIRYIELVAPGQVEVTAWHRVPREESGTMRSLRSDSLLTFLGPGGFATPDDVEAVESCQAGFGARGVEWSDVSRGMLRTVPQGTDALQMRGFWRQWHGHLMGLDNIEMADRELRQKGN